MENSLFTDPHQRSKISCDLHTGGGLAAVLESHYIGSCRKLYDEGIKKTQQQT
jgi:hypothetical protein